MRYQIWTELEVSSGAAAELDKNCTCIFLGRTNNERTTSRIKAKVHGSVQERYGDTSRDKQDTRHVCAKRGGGVGAGLSDEASPCAQQDRHGDNECKRQDVSNAERRIGDREV